MTRSRFTLEPYQTPEEIYKEMVELYLLEKGYGDLHDVYKTLLPIDPAAIGIQLFSVIEDCNEENMLKNNHCPECGHDLEYRSIEPTRTDPGEEWDECPQCLDRYKGRAS